MTKINIPRGLPKCELIKALATRSQGRDDIDFNFFGCLDAFRERVAGEVSRINELFPEYTPHDEQYHLKKLFHVAGTVLDKNLIARMNSAELFVLACGLYAHDWGMAVSVDEKDYIVSGKLTKGRTADELWILPDERDRFINFARDHQITLDTSGYASEISIEQWREYVRETHAWRSATRVKRYFEAVDGGIADSVSRICVAHWLSFEKLHDFNLYPADFGVLHESVNLRALAIYLRLIDMLDLGEDRTPYVIWKYVAPRDPKSKMEWDKHRALRPATCPKYQDGRIILIDGSTDNHEVYAAVEDFRDWCEEQFEGCSDLLAHMNDPRHKLDIYHIEWRIAAVGFEPVTIRFEFDRERMFEILGDEIYQGDPYVFLRELLQNSIDAIRMRREIMGRRGIMTQDVGVIRVNVTHDTNGDAEVVWQDDGIGMDEYVIKNYLSVAGKSYYQSEDFKKMGLQMDPISRFGVGILSCFMVADRIEIETYKDPYFGPRSDFLKIGIPSVKGQFRIEKKNSENALPGTRIKVFVKKGKLSQNNSKDESKPLDVTGYLSMIAGFVEFPIVVTEDDKRTIILHPKDDANNILRRFGSDFKVQKLDLSYPWAEIVLPQDLTNARMFLREEVFKIRDDLGLKDYDGVITYLVPNSNDMVFSKTLDRLSEIIKKEDQQQYQIRFCEPWEYGKNIREISRSARRSVTQAVYRDGILLATPSCEGFNWQNTHRELPPKICLFVNLPMVKTPKLDVARTQIVSSTQKWFQPILKAHRDYILGRSVDHLLTLKPLQRLQELAVLSLFHRMGPQEVWDRFPKEHWPIVFFERCNNIVDIELRQMKGEKIVVCPSTCDKEYGKVLCLHMLHWGDDSEILKRWNGGKLMCPSRLESVPAIVVESTKLIWFGIAKTHCLSCILFVTPPWEKGPALFEEMWAPITVDVAKLNSEALLEKTADNPLSLEPAEVQEVGGLIEKESKWTLRLPLIVEFGKPFDQKFGYGGYILNLKHPITQALLQIMAKFQLAEIRGTISKTQLGHLRDYLSKFDMSEYKVRSNFRKIQSRLRDGLEGCQKMGFFDVGNIDDVLPNLEDFVPDTVSADDTIPYNTLRLEMPLSGITDVQEFGMPLV